MDNHEGNKGAAVLPGAFTMDSLLQRLDSPLLSGKMDGQNGGADSFVQVPPLQMHQLRRTGNCGVRGGIVTFILFKKHFFKEHLFKIIKKH